MPSRPRIHLIATGGTIAGTASDPTDTRKYTAGVLTAEELIASVPPLKDLAEISVEQLYNLDSKDMTPDHWLGLARATQAALAREDVDGVVITHGTDTMEESAFFLDLVLPPGKPVVFTGAMRPATALSADGPMNIFSAMTIAADSRFGNQGVLVCLGEVIHTAVAVTKTGGIHGCSFKGGEIGRTTCRGAYLVNATAEVVRNVYIGSLPATLPSVGIIWAYPGSNPRALAGDGAIPCQGWVIVVPSSFALPSYWFDAVFEWIEDGLKVVLAAERRIELVAPWIDINGARVPCSRLPPRKARIAIMIEIVSGQVE